MRNEQRFHLRVILYLILLSERWELVWGWSVGEGSVKREWYVGIGERWGSARVLGTVEDGRGSWEEGEVSRVRVGETVLHTFYPFNLILVYSRLADHIHGWYIRFCPYVNINFIPTALFPLPSFPSLVLFLGLCLNLLQFIAQIFFFPTVACLHSSTWGVQV